MKPGDWLQHHSLKQELRIRQRHVTVFKRAEVISTRTGEILVYRTGEPGTHSLRPEEVFKHWGYFVPWKDPDAVRPSSDVTSGSHFHVLVAKSSDQGEVHHERFRAEIRTVNGAWISFLEDCQEYSEVFRLMPYQEFLEDCWQPEPKTSVWAWLRSPAV